MANPHHEELDQTRGKESSIWVLKLPKELRNDVKLACTYLLEPPTWRKLSLKPSFPLVFYLFLESSSPDQAMGSEVWRGGEMESVAFDGHV